MYQTLAIVVAILAGFRAEFVALFEPCVHVYSGGGYQNDEFRYRLLVPETSLRPRPLIVWLHGKGEAGSDNIRQLLWLEELICTPPIRRDRFPFYLLAVQCPRSNPVWTTSDPDADEMVNVVMSIVDELLGKYEIDRDRIYLAGLSSGGAGCWSLASRKPEYFAAVAAMASTVDSGLRIERMKELPVWAFHSRADSATPADSVRAGVERLRSAGGNVHLTEIDSSAHDCWNAAFHEYHLLDWLLSQRRGEPGIAPGTVPAVTQIGDFLATWKWWQILVQVGMPIAIVTVVWSALRRRPRQTKPPPLIAEQGLDRPNTS